MPDDDDLSDLAGAADHEKQWGAARPSNGLLDVAQGGAPPSIPQAIEHQRRWGRPLSQELSDLAGHAANMVGTIATSPKRTFERVHNLWDAATSNEDPYSRAYAGAELARMILTEGMMSGPRDALGMTGGRMVQPSRISAAGEEEVSALHASPYNFNKFDMSKIGTGEGNAARGHGLYLAENPQVSGPGGHYDAQFTAQNLGKAELNNLEKGILRAIRAGHDDLDIAAAISERSMQGSFPISFDTAAESVSRIRAAKSTIYDTKIKAPPHHFIDWDLPLGRQSPHAQSGLVKVLNNNAMWRNFANRPVGDVISQYNQVELAKALRDKAGLPGFKFLDRYSRAGKSPGRTFNYVVNDDNLLQIMGKMGIAGFGALPAMGIWHYQGQEQ